MNDKSKDYIIAIIVAIYIIICSIFSISAWKKNVTQDVKHKARELMEKEAVLSGHAEYIAGTNGEPVFTWKNCK